MIRSRKDAIDDFAAEVESRLHRRTGAELSLVDEEVVLPDAAVDAEGAASTRMAIGALLVRKGHVTDDQLQSALTTQATSGQRLGEILVDEGAITERVVAQVLAEQFGLGTVDLLRTKLDPAAIQLVPSEVARKVLAIPIRRDGDRVEVAVADPSIPDLQKVLIDTVKAPVRLLVASRRELIDTLDRSYQDTGAIGDALRDFEEKFGDRKRTEGAQQQIAVDENAPVVRVVNLIFERAVRERASDIHIEPQESRIRIRVRTDGALHEVMSLPSTMGVPLVSRIKVLADMNIVERRRAQDGQLEISVAGRDLDVRVATSATVWGEKAVLRLLDKTRAFYKLRDLGMGQSTLDVYEDLIRSPYGMMICAGPTGSGKTTTLYATLAAIDNDEINVVTIEDPVEYLFPNINQIQINEQAGVTFANGLRSILRQDPDAILVGEIRDIETARIAVQAALTGHFVMSSLHAIDSTSALHRFMDMGIEPFLIASSLRGVVGQRLLRKNCPHCLESYEPTVDELAFYNKSGGDAEKSKFLRGAGCNQCGQTGYYERIGVYEVLPITDKIKEMIVVNASLRDLRDAAVAEGMRSLRSEAIALVERDQTTIAEVLRTVYVL